jgi:hypothetical protein
LSETFITSLLSDGTAWSQEMPVAAVTGHPYLEHVAALALFNLTGSGKIIRVKAIAIQPIAPVTSNIEYRVALQRITALAGGETVPAVALDSNNAALPSQVSIVANGFATLTGSELARKLAVPIQNMTRALGALGNSHGGLSSSRIWKLLPHSDVQRIILREGQGISITPAGANRQFEIDVTLWLRNVSTGACYVVHKALVPTHVDWLAVLNGSGSGVVLELFDCEIVESGVDDIPQFSIEGIDGCGTSYSGEVVSPIKTDSTSSLSGSVLCLKNAVVKSDGANSGALISMPWKQRVRPTNTGRGPGIAPVVPTGITPNWIFYSRGPDYDTILREGKGLGIFNRNAGKVGRFEFRVDFTQESSGGGSPAAATVAFGWAA